MFKAAKVLIRNDRNELLVLYRNEHPQFGNSADLPGGTVERKEHVAAAAVREVQEETGIVLDISTLEHRVTSRAYGGVFEQYSLFEATLEATPEVTLSWEHGDFGWLTADAFIDAAQRTDDRFNHLVIDFLQGKL